MNISKNTSESELVDGIKKLLKSNGYLNKMQAEMRTKIVEAIRSRQDAIQAKEKDAYAVNSKPPTPNEEIALVNELIREYLEWNGYLYTASVLSSEAGLPTDKKSRADLCTDVGVKDDDSSSRLPLLANIVIAYTERIKRKLSKTNKKEA